MKTASLLCSFFLQKVNCFTTNKSTASIKKVPHTKLPSKCLVLLQTALSYVYSQHSTSVCCDHMF